MLEKFQLLVFFINIYVGFVKRVLIILILNHVNLWVIPILKTIKIII